MVVLQKRVLVLVPNSHDVYLGVDVPPRLTPTHSGVRGTCGMCMSVSKLVH